MKLLPRLVLHESTGKECLSSWDGPAAWRAGPRTGTAPQVGSGAGLGVRLVNLSLNIGPDQIKLLSGGKYVRWQNGGPARAFFRGLCGCRDDESLTGLLVGGPRGAHHGLADNARQKKV
jgi:hypothetical protein